MSVPNRLSLRTWAPLIALVLLCILFGTINPEFLSVRNFGRIGLAASPGLLVAIGVTFVIIMGSIDLSMEGVVSFCSVVQASILVYFGSLTPWGWIGIPAALVVGFAMGGINGLVHVKLRIPSFMSSLCMSFIGAGSTFILTGGYRIRVEDGAFRSLLTLRIFDQPLMVYVAVAGLLVALFIERYTVLGRNFYAVGGGEDLARASGMRVDRVRVMGFALAGIFFALGGILTVARLGVADGDSGSNLMFSSITAVVVGGTTLMGGRGSVLNTLVGVLIITVINNGMIASRLPNYLQSGVLGVIVILAIALSISRKSGAFVK